MNDTQNLRQLYGNRPSDSVWWDVKFMGYRAARPGYTALQEEVNFPASRDITACFARALSLKYFTQAENTEFHLYFGGPPPLTKAEAAKGFYSEAPSSDTEKSFVLTAELYRRFTRTIQRWGFFPAHAKILEKEDGKPYLELKWEGKISLAELYLAMCMARFLDSSPTLFFDYLDWRKFCRNRNLSLSPGLLLYLTILLHERGLSTGHWIFNNLRMTCTSVGQSTVGVWLGEGLTFERLVLDAHSYRRDPKSKLAKLATDIFQNPAGMSHGVAAALSAAARAHRKVPDSELEGLWKVLFSRFPPVPKEAPYRRGDTLNLFRPVGTLAIEDRQELFRLLAASLQRLSDFHFQKELEKPLIKNIT